MKKEIPTINTKQEMEQEKRLIGNINAKIWAEEFVKTVKKNPKIATDEETMQAWFANAIMAGYDSYGMRRNE